MNCLECRRPVGELAYAKSRKYCSVECRSLHYKKIMQKQNRTTGYGLPTGTVGAIGEMVVCADLLRKGYEVFRAVAGSASCDLAVLKNGKLVRVEVTTGHRTIGGGVGHPNKSKSKAAGKHDILAVAIGDKVIYDPGEP